MSQFDAVQDEIEYSFDCLIQARELIAESVGKDAFEVVVDFDEEARRRTYRLIQIKELPKKVPHLLRTSLLDAKHSFDRSLSVAAKELGNENFRGNFPWGEEPNHYEGFLLGRQKREKHRLPDPLLDEVRRLAFHRYYPKGNLQKRIVRELAEMANRKHDLGIACSAEVDFAVNDALLAGVEKPFQRWDPIAKEAILGIFPENSIGYADIRYQPVVRFHIGDEMFMPPAVDSLLIFVNWARTALERFRTLVN